MLDTNTCIFTIKYHPESVAQRLARIAVGDVAISSIVVAELACGVVQSEQRERNQRALDQFLAYVETEDWPAEAAEVYGDIRSALRRAGTPIGAMDLLIASHALYTGSRLVTDNVREFERVAGLQIENWRD